VRMEVQTLLETLVAPIGLGGVVYSLETRPSPHVTVRNLVALRQTIRT